MFRNFQNTMVCGNRNDPAPRTDRLIERREESAQLQIEPEKVVELLPAEGSKAVPHRIRLRKGDSQVVHTPPLSQLERLNGLASQGQDCPVGEGRIPPPPVIQLARVRSIHELAGQVGEGGILPFQLESRGVRTGQRQRFRRNRAFP